MPRDGERSKTSTCSTIPPPPPLPKTPWMEPRRPAWKPNPTVGRPTARRRRCEGRRRLCRAGRTGRTGAGGRSRLLMLFHLPKHPGKGAGTWEPRHTPRESHPGGSHRSRLRQHRHKSSFLTRPPRKSAGDPIPTVSRFRRRFAKGKVRPHAICRAACPRVPTVPVPPASPRAKPDATRRREAVAHPQKNPERHQFFREQSHKNKPHRDVPTAPFRTPPARATPPGPAQY